MKNKTKKPKNRIEKQLHEYLMDTSNCITIEKAIEEAKKRWPEKTKKTPKSILLDVMNIIKTHIELKQVIGIYLAGSYAREEQDKTSDIDILVISDSISKEMIKQGSYNILIVSQELLKQKLERDLFPIGPMIKEAQALINDSYLNSIEIKVTEKNVGEYLKTTENKLEIIKKFLKRAKPKKIIDDRVIYTLILRIRTLQIIKNLIENKNYSKKEFQNTILKVSGTKNAYLSYLAVKNDSEGLNQTTKEEAEKLASYLENQLDSLKKII